MSQQSINQLILALYRTSHEVPYHHFKENALELLKQSIDFDSAWWGIASANPLKIHRLHLHNCPATIVDDYPLHMAADFFREALIKHPEVSINLADLISREAYVRSPLYRHLGRHYKIEWSLGTLLIEPVSSLMEFVTLWRHDGLRPFNEDERQTKELLMPHLAQAHRNARLHHLLADGLLQGSAWAVTDDQAYLREVSPAFIARLSNEWPDWQGSHLPEALQLCISQGCSFKGKKVLVDVSPREGFYFLEARYPSPLERLAPREREVAQRYGQGQTYAEIATALFLSPATVRNLISRCYKKLGVNNKSELIHRISRH